MQHHDRIDIAAAENRLERSVASVLRIIDAAQVERQAPSVRAARDRIGRIYGVTRLARARERLSAS
jgi:hypothetical protein